MNNISNTYIFKVINGNTHRIGCFFSKSTVRWKRLLFETSLCKIHAEIHLIFSLAQRIKSNWKFSFFSMAFVVDGDDSDDKRTHSVSWLGRRHSNGDVVIAMVSPFFSLGHSSANWAGICWIVDMWLVVIMCDVCRLDESLVVWLFKSMCDLNKRRFNWKNDSVGLGWSGRAMEERERKSNQKNENGIVLVDGPVNV